ncbi:metallophosphoesterase family protein [Microbacterium sp. EF45047]|uniref:metallophosphoesterase family protein n=1 Tax=Microbacterium sp. EF45047 TaxID=2809708 RepID=UPI00234B6F8A|nr:metallophosphoesterase [Microbacterium sp. EF45047]WCM56362.1 metallophosphoesterase [Microbacterium sp. EF45047]
MLAVVALAGCGTQSSGQPERDPTPSPTVIDSASFAIITDYGNCDSGSRAVADMVMTWSVSLVATAGDNTQGTANCLPFIQSVHDYYGRFLSGPGGPRFFPVPGNHDYDNEGAGIEAYRDYFSYLEPWSGKTTWYQVATGDVHLFMIDSETQGDALEKQRMWLKRALTDVSETHPDHWSIVIFHRPPFTSGPHEANTAMRPQAGWNYGEWGADLIVNGHQHVLEELHVDGLTYLVAGVGASDIARDCPAALDPTSTGCVSGPGALLVTSTPRALTLEYRAPDGGLGTVVRTFEVTRRER